MEYLKGAESRIRREFKLAEALLRLSEFCSGLYHTCAVSNRSPKAFWRRKAEKLVGATSIIHDNTEITNYEVLVENGVHS